MQDGKITYGSWLMMTQFEIQLILDEDNNNLIYDVTLCNLLIYDVTIS